MCTVSFYDLRDDPLCQHLLNPFALVVEQLTLPCMKKGTHFSPCFDFLLSGKSPSLCRGRFFCFFQRQVYAEVRSDGSKQKLHFDDFAGDSLKFLRGNFVLQLDSLGFGFRPKRRGH